MDRLTKRVVGGCVVLVCALAAGFGARGAAGKPVAEHAEAFREKGPADAKVTIAEFSDFQCPACRVAEPPLRQLLSIYGADVRFVFKNFPLEHVHYYARRGATAAECAGRQGKFWPFHDMLYDRQDEWTNSQVDTKLAAYAKELGLDLDAFNACLKDPATQKAIDADVKEAENRWVNSTPTFFINGQRFVGARQLQERGTRLIAKVLGK